MSIALTTNATSPIVCVCRKLMSAFTCSITFYYSSFKTIKHESQMLSIKGP